MACDGRSQSNRQCISAVPVKLVVTTGTAFNILIRVIARHFHLVIFFDFVMVVWAVISSCLLLPVESMDVSAYDGCNVFRLTIRMIHAITRIRLASFYWCLHITMFCCNVVLEVWIITVHFLLEFKQSLTWFTLTLNHKLRSIMNLHIIMFFIRILSNSMRFWRFLSNHLHFMINFEENTVLISVCCVVKGLVFWHKNILC